MKAMQDQEVPLPYRRGYWLLSWWCIGLYSITGVVAGGLITATAGWSFNDTVEPDACAGKALRVVPYATCLTMNSNGISANDGVECPNKCDAQHHANHKAAGNVVGQGRQLLTDEQEWHQLTSQPSTFIGGNLDKNNVAHNYICAKCTTGLGEDEYAWANCDYTDGEASEAGLQNVYFDSICDFDTYKPFNYLGNFWGCAAPVANRWQDSSDDSSSCTYGYQMWAWCSCQACDPIDGCSIQSQWQDATFTCSVDGTTDGTSQCNFR